MRKFTDNQLFINSVKDNDVGEIKRLLIDTVFFLQGDREEIDNAIQYALDNSDFTFEEHENIEVSDKKDIENYFSEEQLNIIENYSIKRFNLLVDLYVQVFRNKEYTYTIQSVSVNNKVFKTLPIVIAIAIGLYALYKMIN